MKTSITQDEYLMVIGLLTVAHDHNQMLARIERSLAGILGVPNDDLGGGAYYGHASDAVYSDYTADELLKNLKITVEGPEL